MRTADVAELNRTIVETRPEYRERMRETVTKNLLTPKAVRSIAMTAQAEGHLALASGRANDAWQEFSFAGDLCRWLGGQQ